LNKQKEKSVKSPVIKNINDRISLSVKSMLFDAIFVYDLNERKKLLQELKSKNLYPYKFIAYDLRPKVSLKRALMDWSMLLFPIEIYYLCYSFCLEKVLNLKKSRMK
jgi:hypothetical protein